MNKFFYTLLLLSYVHLLAGQCPSGGIQFINQTEIDEFVAMYPNCTEIQGNLNITEDVVSLIGLENLITVTGNLNISYCDELTSLNGLNNLTTIGGSLNIIHNYSIASLEGLNSLTSIGETLLFVDNMALQSAAGLENLTSIGLDLKVYGQYNSVGMFDGMENLETIGRDLSVDGGVDGALLSSLGLPMLTSIGRHLYLRHTELEDLTGLGNLTTIGGDLQLLVNSELETLDGIETLTTIGGQLNIFENVGLNNLDGLINLTEIGGDLKVDFNSLSSIEGLANIDPTSITDLLIRTNWNLSNCAIAAVCDYLSIASNTFTIEGNGSNVGCNSSSEILMICNPPLCPEGDVSLTNQAEVDAFVAMYPNCTEISGDLRIGFSTDLSGLNNLTTIVGDLKIELNPELTSLTGLNNLTTVGGGMEIAANEALTNLTGLNNLNSIGGRLNIVGNNGLTDLMGLNNLNAIGEGFYLSNDALTSLTGLNNLTTIGGYLEIIANPALTDLTGLNNLNAIGGYLGIFTNNSLTNLTGLSSLNAIGEYLSIRFNGTLTDLAGLQNIDPSTLSGPGLIIDNNPQLSNCAIENICAYLDVDANPANIIGNATTCASREEVENACVTLLDGDAILLTQADVDTFITLYPNIIEITGNLQIGSDIEMSDISDLTGFPDVSILGGDLWIGYNPNLVALNCLSMLNTVGGNLTIEQNAMLADLNELSALSSVGGTFSLESNSELTNILGLLALTSIGGELMIINNPLLTTLNGLNSLTAVNGSLQISANTALTSLMGLEQVDPFAIENLFIQSNPMLNICDLSNICTYLGAQMGEVDISENAMGCESQEAVLQACTVSTIDISDTDIKLFPNPTIGKLQLNNIIVEQVEVFTPQGQRIAHYFKPGQELDLSTLKNGIYHLRLYATDGIYTARVVKL